MAWPFHAKTRHVSIDGCWTVTVLEEALLGDMYLRGAFDQDHLGQMFKSFSSSSRTALR
jgi:hypothetical protein